MLFWTLFVLYVTYLEEQKFVVLEKKLHT